MNSPSAKQHTQGPWEVSRGYNATGYPCFYINGMAGDQKRDVATLDANARLIAAAPDLLQALIDLGDWLAYGLNKTDGAEPTAEDHATCERVAQQASAAIAKATGAT